ncbi:hypothetical protein CNY67_09830 [Desulfovibrio sp. G11]|nr:hypothetical protein CNY67_09830 [Desulfovibrio sp. G11]
MFFPEHSPALPRSNPAGQVSRMAARHAGLSQKASDFFKYSVNGTSGKRHGYIRVIPCRDSKADGFV